MRLLLATVVVLVCFFLCFYMLKPIPQGAKALIAERTSLYEKILEDQR